MLLVDSAPQSWIDIVQSGGVVGMFCVLAWALLKRKLVVGWTYDAMVEERDYYRSLAHRGSEIADRQATVAEALAARMGVLDARHDGPD